MDVGEHPENKGQTLYGFFPIYLCKYSLMHAFGKERIFLIAICLSMVWAQKFVFNIQFFFYSLE